jgi:hypothetical protein
VYLRVTVPLDWHLKESDGFYVFFLGLIILSRLSKQNFPLQMARLASFIVNMDGNAPAANKVSLSILPLAELSVDRYRSRVVHERFRFRLQTRHSLVMVVDLRLRL